MKLIPPSSEYQRVFDAERLVSYPIVDEIEARYGHAVDREQLETAARVLACPVKAHAPNWQHGRVLYAVARQYLAHQDGPVTILDIGTAKGFSALCLEWARLDARVPGAVVSVDVIDPQSHARRNTVAECAGLKTLYETLEPWPEAAQIVFWHRTGLDWLRQTVGRVHVAYVDGKHTYDVAKQEGELLAARQIPGDVAIFDDVQIEGVWQAVCELQDRYAFEIVRVQPHRAYAIGRRR